MYLGVGSSAIGPTSGKNVLPSRHSEWWRALCSVLCILAPQALMGLLSNQLEEKYMRSRLILLLGLITILATALPV